MEETATTNHKREVVAARQNRYTTIAEQLSSEHETIRLAGIYALSALSDEWENESEIGQRDVCIELICAYLRANPRNDSDLEVRSAAVSVIRNHMRLSRDVRWPGKIIDLTGAHLVEANLSECNLSGVKFNKADLSRANLQGVNFTDTTAREVKFRGTKFENSNLQKARFVGCDLSVARFVGCDLRRAMFTAARASAFSFTIETPLNLHFARFWMADLRGADLETADIGSSDQSNEAKFSLSLQTHHSDSKKDESWAVMHDEDTKWPPGFDIKKTIDRQEQTTSS